MGSKTANCSLTWTGANWCLPGVASYPYFCHEALECGARPRANLTARPGTNRIKKGGAPPNSVPVYLVPINESLPIDKCLVQKQHIPVQHFQQLPSCELLDAEKTAAAKPKSTTTAPVYSFITTDMGKGPVITYASRDNVFVWPTPRPTAPPRSAARSERPSRRLVLGALALLVLLPAAALG